MVRYHAALIHHQHQLLPVTTIGTKGKRIRFIFQSNSILIFVILLRSRDFRLHSERRHNKNAYDIDNIVIPSNMSTSRVEILSYKEIPTPK